MGQAEHDLGDDVVATVDDLGRKGWQRERRELALIRAGQPGELLRRLVGADLRVDPGPRADTGR